MSICSQNYKHPKSLKRVTPFFLLFVAFLFSCNITRNVPDGKYLLNKSSIKIESKDIKAGDLETYLRQKPNKKIVGFRFHLRVYNTANPYKYTGLSKRLKIIGEEPVILDTFLTSQGKKNIDLYLKSKGYYQAKVTDTIIYNGKKADILFSVVPNTPYKIKKIKYVVEDTSINQLVVRDTLNSLVNRGKKLDMDLLQEERTRIQNYLQNCGYYFFTTDFITFTADTSIGQHKVDLLLNIKKRYRMTATGVKVPINFLKYKINKVFLYPNFDARKLMSQQKTFLIDTVIYNDINFIFAKDPGIEYKVVDQLNLVRPGVIYSDEIVEKTQNNINSLRLFRMVNIYFNEVAVDSTKKSKSDDFLFFEDSAKKDTVPIGLLDCYIQLTSHTLQSYQVEFVGTNTSGAFGAEGNLNYQHKNLFKGAEIFDIKLRGMVETVSKNQGLSSFGFRYSIELGGSVSLSVPKFLSPFESKEFVKKYSPRTQISSSYNFQRRPEYTRTIASLLFGYYWKNTKYITHAINPIEISAINLTNISDDFKTQISGKYLENSYKNQIITLSSYGFTFNNQNLQKNTSYTYLRLNLESSGNMLSALYSQFGTRAADSTYKILNTSFSQYLRSDFNLTYHKVKDVNNTIVYRIFAGVGYAYGNSKALPFDKKYFSGGANGIRAWSARSLGPGSVKGDTTNYPNQTGDIKLEANLEYRFKIFWQLEGALFLDAGNIWAFEGKDENPQAIFRFNSFYKQIALGTGFGFRANLGFLTVRFDFGYQLRDPAIPKNEPKIEKWIFLRDKKFSGDYLTFNFGIGYPF
jgi:outer membrane protein assembly factor BamA